MFFPLARDLTVGESMRYAFDTLFFESKPWIAVANILHSPVIVGALFVGSRAAALSPTWQRRLGSFAAGCALHIAMDVPVHHDDGPVLLWPLDWSYRFESPVSYWDPEHFGRIVAPIDLAITIVGGATLARSWWRAR